MVEYMQQTHQLGQRQACKAVRLPRSSFSYKQVGKPRDGPIIEELTLMVDNGPESIGNKLGRRCLENQVVPRFVQPGKPTQNAFIERLNGSMRREALNAHAFLDLNQAREMLQQWMLDYNYKRPHQALGNKTPIEYAA